MCAEPLTLGRDQLGQPLHQLGDEAVGFADRPARLVHEPGLDLQPAGGKAPALVGLDQLGAVFLACPGLLASAGLVFPGHQFQQRVIVQQQVGLGRRSYRAAPLAGV